MNGRLFPMTFPLCFKMTGKERRDKGEEEEEEEGWQKMILHAQF